jgi:hypothetical protein
MRTRMFHPVVRRVAFKLLFPIISPRYVAQQVLDALEWNRKEVILPYHLKYIGLIMDFCLPQWLVELLMFHLSGRRPLEDFHKNTDDQYQKRSQKR